MEPFDNERLTEQIIKLTSRVYNLEKEVERLQGQLQNGRNSVPTPSNVVTPPANYSNPVVKPQAPSYAPAPSAVVTNRPVAAVQQNKIQKKNMESNIGKNVMGVFAALLILLSFVLFAVFTFQFLPDFLKVIILYVISIAFATFGLIKMNKKSSFNAIFMSFAGIGISGVYVVSIIAFFVFNVFNEIVLIMILLAWLVATGIISRLKSKMFLYICNIGLIISSFLLYIQWKEILLGIVLYYLGSVALFYMSKSDRITKDLYWLIQIPLITFIFIILYADNPIALTIIAILSAVFFIAQMFIYDFGDEKNGEIVVPQIFSSILLLFADSFLSKHWNVYGALIGTAAIASVFVCTFIKMRKKYKASYYIAFYTLVLSLPLLNIGFVADYLGYIIFAVPLIVIGYIIKDNHFKYTGIFFYFMYMFAGCNVLTSQYVLLISAIVFAGLVVMVANSYKLIDKILMTILLLCLFAFANDVFNFSESMLIIAYSVLSILMNTKLYRNNPVTKIEEKASVIIGYIFNAIMIFFGLIMISIDGYTIQMDGNVIINEIATLIIFVALTLALVSINVVRLVENKKHEMLYGIYTCLKLTVFIIVVLARFDIVPMIISIISILVAISFIVLGFVFKHKSFRIYGLVLTMVFVIKLCLVDISYDSDIMRPIGFFVAGILCFAISWIYSRLEKNTHASEDEESKAIESKVE